MFRVFFYWISERIIYFFLNLENDNFAIIGLEVERPRGGDEAVGLIHHVLPKPSDQG